jgi:hypothetical protein
VIWWELSEFVPGASCHAGSGHSDAADRGPWGWLCALCWEWVQRFRARFRTHVRE